MTAPGGWDRRPRSAASGTLPSVVITERLLMGPGPSNPYPEAVAALSRPLLGHMDPEFITLLDDTMARLRTVFRTLATESAADRAHNPGLEAGRVDVIVGGAIVLVSVMRVLGYDEMLVSEADILDGLVRSQL